MTSHVNPKDMWFNVLEDKKNSKSSQEQGNIEHFCPEIKKNMINILSINFLHDIKNTAVQEYTARKCCSFNATLNDA